MKFDGAAFKKLEGLNVGILKFFPYPISNFSNNAHSLIKDSRIKIHEPILGQPCHQHEIIYSQKTPRLRHLALDAHQFGMDLQ